MGFEYKFRNYLITVNCEKHVYFCTILWSPFHFNVYFIENTKGFFFVVFSGIAKHDEEGRLITAEYDDFYLVGACK